MPLRNKLASESDTKFTIMTPVPLDDYMLIGIVFV